jgi:hypothetical protein
MAAIGTNTLPTKSASHRHIVFMACCLAGLSALALDARPALAQRRAPGDLDPSGRVLAKVIAGMTEPGTLDHPVSRLRILVVAENGDTVTVQTDDAGIATVFVRPGTYRFLSLEPVDWQGRSYSWDIHLPIEPGTGAITFSQATATTTTVLAQPVVPAVPAGQQEAGPRTGPAPSRLRVFADCQTQGCDFDYFRREIPFVDYVRDRQEATLHILITSQPTGGAGTAYTLNFIGQGELAGTADTLRYTAAASSTADEKRSGLARAIKLGLVRYVARTPVGEQLQITYQVPTVLQPSVGTAPPDPWNLWVFSIYLSGDFSGEESQHFSTFRGSTTASRVSESWKSRISFYTHYDESSYTLSDESTFESFHRSVGSSQLLVKSVGSHWSLGERASASSSTFLNQTLVLSFAPAIEFNLFPYSESTRRLLTLQYAVGVKSFRYEDTTIFNKLREVRPHNSVTASLGLKQPWGSVSTSVEAGAYLDDFTKRSAVLFTNVDVRVFKGFSINFYGGLSLLRDQLYLAKGTLSDEDILVRRRQLASTYSYFTGLGISYSFGSIFNNVVNPRFEGISGSTALF